MNGETPNNQANLENNIESLDTLNVTPQINPTVATTNQTVSVASSVNVGEVLGSTAPVETLEAATPVVNTPVVEPASTVAPITTQSVDVAAATTLPPATNPTEVKQASPSAVPIPGTEGINIENKKDNNSFFSPKKTDNIGVIPPPVDNGNKKGSNVKKILFIVLIVILIAGVAYGVYYFLNTSSKKVTLTTKTVPIGIGDIVSDDINEYVLEGSVKGDINNCSLNNLNVTSMEAGTYKYTITCGKDIYDGVVIVSDLTAPDVLLNTVFVNVGDNVTIDDFVASCTDASECVLSYEDEDSLNENLTTAGAYKVGINAADNNNNTKQYEALLYVSASPIKVYHVCASPSEEITGFNGTKTVQDYFPIGYLGNTPDALLGFLGNAVRTYWFTFSSSEDYKQAVINEETIKTFADVTGVATYFANDNTFVITTDLPIDTLNAEASGEFPVNYMELTNYYKEKLYACSNQPYKKVLGEVLEIVKTSE